MKNEWLQDNNAATIRVVVDTNLWISFLIGRKLQGLLDLLDNPWFELVSTAILNEEVIRVARRDKFRKLFPNRGLCDYDRSTVRSIYFLKS
jgi:hypothetical protein